MVGTSVAPIGRMTSFCPKCKSPVASDIFERNGRVYQVTTCGIHGTSETEIFSSSAMYEKLDDWNRLVFQSLNKRVGTPESKREDPWLRSAHSPVLGVIDLTNQCNLRCPLCFAGGEAPRNPYFLEKDRVRMMLESLLRQAPAPCRNIQFSGGEPTLHPDFPEILSMSRDMGFSHIQVATNGIRFLDRDYAARCEEMGLHTLYLQFDGMSEEVYLALRGQRLLAKKLAIVENIARTNMRLVLVPTVVSSVNEDQIGPIFKFALKYSKHVTGISIQPAAHIGRTNAPGMSARPFNLADMAMEFGRQTGLTRFPDDWFPLNAISLVVKGIENLRGAALPIPACDAHCSLGTYFYVDDHDQPTCLNHFLDMEKFFLRMGCLSPKGMRNAFSEKIYRLKELMSISDCFDRRKAPKDLTFQRILRGLDGWEDKSLGRGENWHREGYNGIFVAGMHFMDSGNYNMRRLRRCIIQYVTTEGKLVPFCAYNAGLRVRSEEESRREQDSEVCRGAYAGTAGC